MAEALTGLSDRLTAKRYLGFREILSERDADAAHNVQRFLFAVLFGDAATAFVLGRPREGGMNIGPAVHATNLAQADTEILRMNDGGIRIPGQGVPFYEMASEVPKRGSVYVSEVLSRLARRYGLRMEPGANNLPAFDFYTIHTGSRKILHAVFRKLNLDETGRRARESLDVLARYANTSACSVPLMLAQRWHTPEREETGLAIAFGVGFSASAALVRSRPVH